jgi:hypothetical protein
MQLEDLIDDMRALPDEECIFARKPWLGDSEAVAARFGQNFKPPPSVSALGLEYFLEVHVAREVLEVLGARPA